MSEWISVGDRLPAPIDEQVLTYNEWGAYGIRVYNQGDWFNEYGQSTMNIAQDIEPITHWMPLPAPPAKEQPKAAERIVDEDLPSVVKRQAR